MNAFVGLGLLGSGFARAMLRRGEKVNVWNRSPDKARVLEADGAKAFEKVEDCVRGASRVHVTLSDDAAVDAIVEAIRPVLAPGAVILDHSTTLPAGTEARAARLEGQKIAFLHTPVFMAPQNALEATGVMLACGPQARFDLVKGELEKMTGKVVYLGADPKRAAIFKLLGNLMLVEMMTSVADVFSLAKAAGVPAQEASTLFEFFNPAALLPPRVKRMLDAKFDEPSWTLEMARKDVRLMLETAEKGKTHLIELPGVAQEMDALLARGLAKQDWMVLAKDAVSKG